MKLDKYRGLFLDEARERLDALARELEAGPPFPAPAVDVLFRHAHSIKGMAAAMGIEPIRELAHAMEDLLGQARTGALDLGGDERRRLLAATDVLVRQLEAWERGAPLPAAADGRAALAGSKAVPPAAASLPAQPAPPELELEPGPRAAAEATASPPAPAPERTSVRVATAFIDSLLERVTELALAHGSLRAALPAGASEELRRGLDQLRRSLDRLREDTMAIRLLPLSTIVPDLARAARDAERTTGKPVRFAIEGGDLALDRAVLESLVDPLVHLIRNAVDHGLEPAPARAAAGKPPAGEVRIAARREADSIYVSVRDDGRGMDPEAIAARAAAGGRVTAEEAERMTRGEKLLLATLPGFTTAEAVTALSGRGVGLDLVRARIEGLGGKIELASEAGRWTEVTLRAPLTLALQRLFLVRSGGVHLALPVARVAGVVRLRSGDPVGSPRGPLARLGADEAYPAIDLACLLGQAPPPDAAAGVLVEARGRRILLRVEEAMAEAELVVRPLGRPLQRLGLYSAAAILAEGRVALVLDADGLVGP